MKPNLRLELRAYEAVDPCRVAAILLELTADGSGFTRDDVVARWFVHYPRHAEWPGNRAIRDRISKAFRPLKAAGMVTGEGDGITVTNRERLVVAARNLEIVQDEHGVGLTPAEWSRRPEAPEHLHGLQAAREEVRQQDLKAKS